MWWRGPGNFVGKTMTCRDNRVSCLHLMNGGDRAAEIGNAEPVIDHLIVHFSKGVAVTPILIAEAGTSVTIKRCSITADEAPSQPVAFGGTKARRVLDKSCMDGAGSIVWSKAQDEAASAAPNNGFDLGEVLPDSNGDGLIALSNKTADRFKLPRGTVLRSLGGTRYEKVTQR